MQLDPSTEFAQYSEGVFLAFNKQSADNLPLTTFTVGFAPCLDTSESTYRGDRRNLYPTEFDATNTECSVLDSRYSTVSDDFEISLYDFQDQNGVLDQIESMPMSDKYVDFDFKRTISQQLWQRPTTPWSLSCDAGNEEHTRSDFIW